MKTSTTHSYCEDDMHNEAYGLNIDANKNESHQIDSDSHCRKRVLKVVDNEGDYDSFSDNEEDSDGERRISDSLNEDDFFLTSFNGITVSAV